MIFCNFFFFLSSKNAVLCDFLCFPIYAQFLWFYSVFYIAENFKLYSKLALFGGLFFVALIQFLLPYLGSAWMIIERTMN